MMLSYHIGLDLGQASDFTAIAIVERDGDAGEKDAALKVRHLQRFALGTTYPAIIEAVAGIMANLPKKTRLAVDATGVGRPVIDLLRTAGFSPIAVTVTGGDTATHEGMNWKIPKRELVAGVQVALQQGRLQIARALPEAETLIRELTNYKVTISDTGHVSYGAWRESIHDDLVFAVGLAVWSAEKFHARPGQIRALAGRVRW
jgi:phage FluMu gp28-like protein